MTLLELLVVLCLVGMLAGIAYPSYRSHLLRAHRLEAIEALLALSAAQERFHLEHGRYAEGFVPADDAGLSFPAITAGDRYRLSLESPGPGSYAARAIALSGSGQDQDARCREFGLDADGRRWAIDRNGRESTGDCWR